MLARTKAKPPSAQRPSESAAPPPALSSPGAPLFVWGTWATMLLVALVFVWEYGSPIPFLDELMFIPIVTGEEPLTPAWLWSQHNEHRNPVPKLVFIGFYKLTGCDSRSMLTLNVLCLAGTALALTWSARALRGWTSYTDAFFPIVLLQLGHYKSFQWAMTFTYVLPTTLVGLTLVLILRTRDNLTPTAAALAGLCLVLLMLSGVNGMVYVPALLLWLGYAGARQWRSGGPRGKLAGLLAAVSALLALAIGGLYFVGYEKPGYNRADALADSAFSGTVKTGLAFLSVGLGPAAQRSWPFIGILLGALMLATGVAVIGEVWRNRLGERPRALGLLFFLLACASLIFALAWGRSPEGGSWGVLSNIYYSSMAVPILCAAYLAWQVCSRRPVHSFVQMCLFTLVTSTLVLNGSWALEDGLTARARRAALERDVLDGVPASLISKRYAKILHWFHEVSDVYLEAMRRGRVGVFEHLQEDPPFQEVQVSVEPAQLHQMTWDKGAARPTGRDSHLIFKLPEPAYVCGIRIKYRHANEEGISPYFRIFWREAGRGDFSEKRSYVHFMLPTGPEEGVVTVWVYDTLDELRVHPDKQPCVFEIVEVVLLLLPAGAPPPGS